MIHDDAYDLYVYDISYFSGKFEAYLRYKDIPFRRHEPSWRTIAGIIHPATGLMKLPVVKTPDGQWLQDSSPMIQWFESKHPSYGVLPDDPYQRFFGLLLEDYADEWMWRPALYFRWAFDKDAQLYAQRFVEDFLWDWPLPNPIVKRLALARQKIHYMRGDGIRPETHAHIESIYVNTLKHLEAILSQTPYLMGERPTIADFGFFASMFKHFSLDPTPARMMREQAPGVYEWVARLWNAKGPDFIGATLQSPGTLPLSWEGLLRDIGNHYLPYLHANAIAFKQERRHFDLSLDGVLYKRLPVVPYRVWCREQLQHAFLALDPATQATAQHTLIQHGCWEHLFLNGTITSNYMSERQHPAVCVPHQLTPQEYALGFLLGTSWHTITD